VIVVCSQRRAIHGVGAPRVTGPEDLVRLDAAWEVIMGAHEGELEALRKTSGPAAGRHRANDLDQVAQRMADDATSWQPAQLTIDGRSVKAIELTHDGWWLVLHIGIAEVVDVYVFGPPGARPTPLVLQSVSETAYQ
jgi:hypothetical protein